MGVLVVPFCVVLAWMMGQPLDLNFNEFEALVLFISVLLAAVVVQVGGLGVGVGESVTGSCQSCRCWWILQALWQSLYTCRADTGVDCCHHQINTNSMPAVCSFLPPNCLPFHTTPQDGTSNWLKGAMLVLTYVFVAAGFWVHLDPALAADN